MTRSLATQSVHVIFKTHLDIGFTDYAHNVLERYRNDFIPRAMTLARTLREDAGNSTDRFVWTTGSWLIHYFLEKSSPRNRRLMEIAIAAGDIVWHAMPFTTHTELMDESLLAYALSLSTKLDSRFGRKTIAAKMSDVTGHTRGLIHVFADAGVKFLHIGVNPASSPPAVPQLFAWRDSGGAELLVMYDKDYGAVTAVPNTPAALAIAFTGDNRGPQTPADIHKTFAALRQKFPGAMARASSLDEFARDILPSQSSFPIITQEIGDTWIYGTACDPAKIAAFRELSRLRRQWLAKGKLKPGSTKHAAFTNPLLLVAEHTWGMDEKTFLDDYKNYAGPQFQRLRKTPRCKAFEKSWQEQRDYLKTAVAALGRGPLANEAKTHLNLLKPKAPKTAALKPLPPTGFVQTKFWNIGFDPATGAINHLRAISDGRIWASPKHPLALLQYQTFCAADFDRYLKQYATSLPDWMIKDVTKPGIERFDLRNELFASSSAKILSGASTAELRVVAELNMKQSGKFPGGCPRRAVIEYIFSNTAPAIDITLQWFDKPAHRLPEAIWFSFVPQTKNHDGWRFHKITEGINPQDVIDDGGRHLHAVQYVTHCDGHWTFTIDPLDSPVVAPGELSLLDFNNRKLTMARGVHFNLLNNLYGTNFRMWYEDDARFRFRLDFA